MLEVHSIFRCPNWLDTRNSHFFTVLPDTHLNKTNHTDIHASDTSHRWMAWFLLSVFTNYLDTHPASHYTIHHHWLTNDFPSHCGYCVQQWSIITTPEKLQARPRLKMFQKSVACDWFLCAHVNGQCLSRRCLA